MQITHQQILYKGASPLCTGWEARHPGVHARAAVVADLHDAPYDRILTHLRDIRPDLILIPGDLTENLTLTDVPPDARPGLGFLQHAAAIAPTFYAWGNHETGGGHIYLRRLAREPLPTLPVLPHWLELIRQSGVTLLDETYTIYHGLVLGGMRSGLLNPGQAPNCDWLQDFCRTPGCRILLCHHPEYFDRYLRPYPIDLLVAGHAHGGQWRLFGRGVYAPNQGFFPAYTSGVHEGRLVISRGVCNTVSPIPRLFNPREIVVIDII